MDAGLKDRIRRTPNRMELLDAANEQLREVCQDWLRALDEIEKRERTNHEPTVSIKHEYLVGLCNKTRKALEAKP